MRAFRRASSLVCLLLVACSSEDPPTAICDAQSLTSALAEALPTESVVVGSCSITGSSFLVPAAVTLKGSDGSELVVTEDGVTLTPGVPPTGLANLTIRSSGKVAVQAKGEGKIGLDDVTVRADLGIGIAVEDLQRLSLNNVTMVGPVTAANASSVPFPADPKSHATHGLVTVRVADVSLNTVDVSGFADIGALLYASTTTWRGGSASDNLGVGLMVEGGAATLEMMAVNRTLQGSRGLPSYGGVFTGTAAVETTDLDVLEGEGYGLLQHAGTANHLRLTSSRNGHTGVWVQHADSLEIVGELSTNEFAGVVAVESDQVNIHSTTIDGTKKALRSAGPLGAIEVGDGVQLVRPRTTQLADVQLTHNERVGLLIDLGGGSLDMTLERVSATAATDQSGAVAQGGTVSSGWDNGVTRTGVSQADDQGRAGTFPSVEAVGPCGSDIDGIDDLLTR